MSRASRSGRSCRDIPARIRHEPSPRPIARGGWAQIRHEPGEQAQMHRAAHGSQAGHLKLAIEQSALTAGDELPEPLRCGVGYCSAVAECSRLKPEV
jgi:hypothetical protein